MDATDGLADSLAGERLAMSFPSASEEDESKYRPMISVKVRAYGQATMLLDSGATDLILLQRGTRSNGSGDTRLTTLNGTMACESTSETVYLGKGMARDFAMVSCDGKTATPRDKYGILPTALFQQIFISHAGAHVIIDPAKRSRVPVVIAAVTSLPQ